MSLPVVAIVGRPNVGKSSLLNCLTGKRIAIVDATPGVTRDRISAPCPLGDAGEGGRYVVLVDTGGIGIEDAPPSPRLRRPGDEDENEDDHDEVENEDDFR